MELSGISCFMGFGMPQSVSEHLFKVWVLMLTFEMEENGEVCISHALMSHAKLSVALSW